MVKPNRETGVQWNTACILFIMWRGIIQKVIICANKILNCLLYCVQFVYYLFIHFLYIIITTYNTIESSFSTKFTSFVFHATNFNHLVFFFLQRILIFFVIICSSVFDSHCTAWSFHIIKHYRTYIYFTESFLPIFV